MEHKIYIILSKSNTLMAKAVRFYTRKKYSHTSLALDASLSTFYSFGRRNPRFMLPAGFIIEGIKNGFFKLYPATQIYVLEAIITDEQLKDIENRLKPFIDSPLEYKYNVLGIIPTMLGISYRRKKHFLCSTFVAYVLYNCFKFKTDYTLVYPEDFFKLNLKKVYEGDAQNYADSKILC